MDETRLKSFRYRVRLVTGRTWTNRTWSQSTFNGELAEFLFRMQLSYSEIAVFFNEIGLPRRSSDRPWDKTSVGMLLCQYRRQQRRLNYVSEFVSEVVHVDE